MFNFTDKKVNIRKDDFSSSKVEKQIFEFFEQNTNTKNFIAHTNFFQRVKMLDFGDDAEKVITEKEIAEFLREAKSQKKINIGSASFETKMLKDVTEEDLIQFFSKVMELSPTYLQAQKSGVQSTLKDENGNTVFTNEVLNNFPTSNTEQNTFNMIDHDGNIISSAVRKQFTRDVLKFSILLEEYDFHKAN